MIIAKNSRRKNVTGSAPVRKEKAIVNTAPTLTQTAYDVPKGRVRIAYARPPMEIISAKMKTKVGHNFVNPTVLLRAIAQTASNTPDAIKMIHAIE